MYIWERAHGNTSWVLMQPWELSYIQSTLWPRKVEKFLAKIRHIPHLISAGAQSVRGRRTHRLGLIWVMPAGGSEVIAERSLEKHQWAEQTEEHTVGASQRRTDTKWAALGFNGIRRAGLALIRGDWSFTHSRLLTAAAWGRWEQEVREVGGSAFYESAFLSC